MGIVETHIDQIRDLCSLHKVKQLFVFGSAVTNRFNQKSDIDFVVDFTELDLYDYADNYFDLKFSLERLLMRNIDLLEEKAISNPYLRQSIDSTKQLVYGQ
jgi:predicted nucleotidyltransferase